MTIGTSTSSVAFAFPFVLLCAASFGCGREAPPPRHSATQKTVEKTLAVTGGGASLERLTSEPEDETHPASSPDGKTLLFGVHVPPQGGRADQQTLVAIDPNTRAQRTLYTSTNSLSDHPAWLPDGSSYVYASNAPGSWSLVRALTGSPNAAVNVIASGEIAPNASAPTVSPDGKRVAFATKIRGAWTIAVIGIDGSRMTLLGEGNSPAWSPDGARLAFTRAVNGHDQLFLVSPETGTDLVQLTSGDFEHVMPSWSPDANYIVFATNRGWNAREGADRKTFFNLYALKKDGTGLTQLTDGDAWTNAPSWGKDSYIYFSSNQAGSFDIWRLRPAGAYANLAPVSTAGSAPVIATPTAPPAPPAPAPHAAPVSTPAPPVAVGCKTDQECHGSKCISGACAPKKEVK